MSGIAGVAGSAGDPPGPEIGHMAGWLRHRGPDASGSRTFGGCALAHTRLRIIDLNPLGEQPMANEDETAWAVFNGEIHNFVGEADLGFNRRVLTDVWHGYLGGRGGWRPVWRWRCWAADWACAPGAPR